MRAIRLLLFGGAALMVSACATNDFAYGGAEWAGERGPYEGALRGEGMEILDRWLADTREGRTIVTLGFSEAANGEVSEDVAHRANIWFRRYADSNRDMRVTDEEIRIALVAAAGRYAR
ncbi:MAG: hypothetical protein AB7O91_01725 [Sphingomonas sp.]